VFLSAEVKWVTPDSAAPRFHRVGLAFIGPAAARLSPETIDAKRVFTAADYEFLREIGLLKRLHPDAVCPLLNHLRFRRVQPGERLITQGDSGDACYIIQRGSCGIHVEKKGEIHRVASRRTGDILGEMALLTGEPRAAHVDAETEMDLWQLSRGDFDRIIQEFAGLRGFLTEIVADRFASSRVTVDRNIGKYLVTDIIGRGGFSIVYKGVHTSLNMPVVIKMLNHDMAMDPQFRSGFEKEARTIAQFNHENIVKVYDIEARFQTLFIVMEYLEGRTLRQVFREMHRLPACQVVHYLLQVCAGLRYAHAHGIIHQDVKPGNIFILPGERVKILDFGLATPCGTESTMSGTPHYMSPEQVECLPVDERADIYALGITTYEMVAGRRPFPEDDPHAVMDLHVAQDVPDPALAVPGLPEGLRHFILKACARDRDQRYRNMDEVESDLLPVAEALDVRAHTPGAGTRKMATLIMLYNEEHQLALNRLMEEFSSRVKELGVVLKVADFQ
jgi:CRP-like cAMP-binding protein